MHRRGNDELDAEEHAMLRGDKGPAVQEAIQFQIEVGSFFEAKRLRADHHAHVMGDIEVMGDGGLEHLRGMGEKHARCTVPTSSNAQCMHFHPDPAPAPGRGGGRSKEKEILARYKTMRIAATDTCIPYQTGLPAESSASTWPGATPAR